VLDPSPPLPDSLPATLHFGFQAPAVQVSELYQRMTDEHVPMDQHLETAGDTVTFYCRDPEGWQVEVRSVG
jgi:hypothetical protein